MARGEDLSIGLSRLGFGAWSFDRAPGDRLAMLDAGLEAATRPISSDRDLPSASQALRDMLGARKMGKQSIAEMDGKDGKARRAPRPAPVERTSPAVEIWATLSPQGGPDFGFGERLVLHWANYFTVAAVKGKVGWTVGPFIREAIRPHVGGSFEALLTAATLHPAMLFYLDNAASIGPGSIVGKKKGAGLNENLGRELLELHTLGVDGGYSQADVTSMAAILTGWGVDLNLDSPTCGEAVFNPRRHEPGPKMLLGQRLPDSGADQLRAALDLLATHPATARNVARRMLAAFLGDAASPADVAIVARSFQQSRGDLRQVTRTMVELDAIWTTPLRKLRAPVELLHVATGIVGAAPPAADVRRALTSMGQPSLQAPSPKGWPEGDNSWLLSDGIKSRLDWASDLGRRFGDRVDTQGIATGKVPGWRLTDETSTALRRAATPQQALALLLMCPEVQRR